MNEVVREFLLETEENLAQLDLDLLALEQNPDEKETIARVFRTLHTVKGTAAFLGLEKLQAVSHAAENLLSNVRSGKQRFGPAIASVLLAVVDVIREIMQSIEDAGNEGVRDDSALIAVLEALTRGEAFEDLNWQQPSATKRSDTDLVLTHTRELQSPPDENLAATMAFPGGTSESAEPHDASTPSHQPRADSPVWELKTPPKEGPLPPATSVEPIELRASPVADSAIRVDVGLLDKLMNIVGELVLTRNHIVQHTANSDDFVLHGAVQRLNLLTAELQAGVMKTRMQPVGAVWGKFPRLVRDLATACGKQVRFEMEGRDIELDKSILESIRDPLTHMVRNAVDHGIELPVERVAAGKSAEGLLRLHAYQEGGKVVIEVADDGGGIDVRKVREKAVRLELISEAAAAKLEEREVWELIFRPGFSTAEKVTQFSGRGVGMDVVRTNIERIGGTVDLESRFGSGTSVRMKIPLTLAIVPALIVGVGDERFAIPQVSLVELVRLERDDEQQKIEFIQSAPVYRLRGRLLPIVFLDRELELSSTDRRQPTDDLLIVVLQADEHQFGLVVDSIHDSEEIVVKPLQTHLKGLNIYSGATIMGDGRVALILNVMGIAMRSRLTKEMDRSSLIESSLSRTTARTVDRISALIVGSKGDGRLAVPIDDVARLEEFATQSLERVGDRLVVQYRNDILPLVQLSECWSSKAKGGTRKSPPRKKLKDRKSIYLVVHERAGRRVGLIVPSIVDVVQEYTLEKRLPATRPGVLFSAVVQGKVCEFLDLQWLLDQVGSGTSEVPTR